MDLNATANTVLSAGDPSPAAATPRDVPADAPRRTAASPDESRASTPAGCFAAPIRISDLRTVWSLDGEMLKVSVPRKFSNVKAFDLSEMKQLQDNTNSAPRIAGGQDSGRFLLLERLMNNALFPAAGWSHRSVELYDHARILQQQLLDTHREVEGARDDIAQLEKLYPIESRAPFGNFHDRVQVDRANVSQGQRALNDSRHEIDAFLRSNFLLIATPAMSREAFYERFGYTKP
jgi:hypothetical protein